MSWFSKTEDYSTVDSGFYGEVEVTYGPEKKDDSGSGSSSSSGGWDDYQRERTNIISSKNDRSR